MGVIAGNRASDQAALNDYLLPDLRNAGVTPIVKTIDADPNDTATTDTQAPLVIQQLRSAGVTSVIPLMPFNVFYPVLQAETAQQYFPKLLLSDYESSILSSLGLLPVPYAKALDGQEGVTTETLGGIDDPRPESQGGYDPGVRACWTIWHKAYPQMPPGNMNDDIEEQGPIVGWCQAINLFTDGGPGGRARSQPAHVRHRHVQDQGLPGHLVSRSQLRPGQALRSDRVPGGQAAHQLASLVAVQDDRREPLPATCWVSVRSLGATTDRLTRMRVLSGVSSWPPVLLLLAHRPCCGASCPRMRRKAYGCWWGCDRCARQPLRASTLGDPQARARPPHPPGPPAPYPRPISTSTTVNRPSATARFIQWRR